MSDWTPPEDVEAVDATASPGGWSPPSDVEAVGEDTGDQVSRTAERKARLDARPWHEKLMSDVQDFATKASRLATDLRSRNDASIVMKIVNEREEIRRKVIADFKREGGGMDMHDVERKVNEIYRARRPDTPDLSTGEVLTQAFDAARDNPGQFAKEMAKDLLANPQYALPVFQEFGFAKLVGSATRAGKVAKEGARVADSAVMAAGIAVPGSVARQVDETGEVRAGRTGADVAMAAGMTAATVAVIGGLKLGLEREAKAQGKQVSPADVAKADDAAATALAGGVDPAKAVKDVLEGMGVEPERATLAARETADAVADASGFIPAADGYRVRIEQHKKGSNVLDPKADEGAFLYEVSKGEGDSNSLLMVLNKEGKLVTAKSVLDGNESNGTAWVPPDESAAAAVRALLNKRAGTRVGSPERAGVDAEIAAVVKGESVGIATEITPEIKATADAMQDVGEMPKAAVRFGGKVFESTNHFIAIKQAMEEGLVPMENGRVKKGPDDSIDLFKLKDGTLITRDQAGELFGAKRTEEMWKSRGWWRKNAPVVATVGRALQEGKMDPELLMAGGAVGAGVIAGLAHEALAEPDDTSALQKAFVGGGIAAAALVARKGIRSVAQATRDTRIRIDNLTDTYFGSIAKGDLAAMRFAHQIKALVPDAKQREALTHYLQGDTSIPVTPEMKAAAGMVNQFFEAMGKVGQDAGVLPKDLIDNYVTQLWTGMNAKDTIWGNLKTALGKRGVVNSPGMAPSSRFAMARQIPSYAEGMKAGMIPQTLDIAEITRVYAGNIQRAIANKRLIESLKRAKAPDGTPLVSLHKPDAIVKEDMKRLAIAEKRGVFATEEAKSDVQGDLAYKGRKDYITVNHPQMAGLKVHPDIAPQMQWLFDAKDPNAATRAAYAISVAAKRGIFSLSMFHTKSLLDALLGTPMKGWKNVVTGEAWRALQGTGATANNNIVRDLVDAGLQVTGRPLEGDVTPFTNALKLFEERFPIAGLPVKGVHQMVKALDKMLWEYVHPTFKAAAGMAMAEKMIAKADKRGLTREQALKDAASFTNDIFGGLDWYRMADSVTNKYGRDIAMALTSPSGRRFLQIGLLAPDWTIATARAMFKAIPGVSEAAVRQAHQGYVLRSALLYLTVAEGLNMHFSGHHLWENDDPTMVDLGDGRKLQLSKHFMEPIHWMTKPGQQALNKLGYVPSEPLKQIMGTEYLSVKGAPPMDTSAVGRIKHAAKGFAPITSQQAMQQGFGPAALGFIGLPIYGRDEATAVKEARERAELKAKNEGKDAKAAADKAERRVKRIYEKKAKEQALKGK